MDKVKVLLDTDPGSDIDDAVCIGYLLSNPACDLLGITTVTGQAAQRAQIASAVCHAFDRTDVPIYPGADRPLVVETVQRDVPHARVLPNWPHEERFPKGEAVAFLRETIRRHPGEVELLAIGALTNVALLFAIDPEIPTLLRGLTIMGGRFMVGAPVHPAVEHNMRCDPHAATRVFDTADLRRATVVGLDVTLQVMQTKDEIRQCFSTEPFRPILDMAFEWFQWAERLCYHDIVAAATLFRPDLFSFRAGTVSSVSDGALMGYTQFREHSEGRHQVAASVDREGFLDHFCATTGCSRVGR